MPPVSAPSSPSASATVPTRCIAPSISPNPPTPPLPGSTPAPASTRRKPPLRPQKPSPNLPPSPPIPLDRDRRDRPRLLPRRKPRPGIQQAAFLAQLQIAAAARKPILIHCRTSELATPAAKEKFSAADAWEDLLALLGEYWQPHALPGIMHCFSGTIEHARRSLDLGFYLSFAGNLTYPAAKTLREAAAFAPADRILVETDAPFLAPIPYPRPAQRACARHPHRRSPR